MSNEEKPKKKKLPTAKKREKQNDKKNLQNRSFKAKVRTTLVRLEKSLEQSLPKEEIEKNLTSIYSVMDKGVKKGIFKKNKAARIKSKYAVLTK